MDMIENCKVVVVDDLMDAVSIKKGAGFRFITITCVELNENSFELIYHFDKDLHMEHLRVEISKEAKAPSISGIFFAAFLVENEIQDQFGLRFDGLVLDYDRTLYLDEEVQSTPFCRYSVKQKEA